MGCSHQKISILINGSKLSIPHDERYSETPLKIVVKNTLQGFEDLAQALVGEMCYGSEVNSSAQRDEKRNLIDEENIDGQRHSL